jgi:hypothetical protein
MENQKKFELLEGLPTYGPMYIPISTKGIDFYHQGFVVRFFKSDGTNWVANFESGCSNYSNVIEIPETDKVIVIANGQGYLMTPDQYKPLEFFGYSITDFIATNDGRFVAADNIDLIIINSDATIWNSERISWDEIKDLVVKDNIVSGVAFYPMYDADEWVNFSFNLDTKEIIGGSYTQNDFKEVKKPFWRFW